jgi:23S rRNA (adenine2503-C2)-methyltransferase
MSERTSLPLVFDEPRGRKKPPRHLADLTPDERKARLEELGLPGFRAKQLSTHYFSRLVDDPAEMTDLPAAQRDELVEGLLP